MSWLKQRNLSIKGRALALNTRVTSMLWYVASTVPLCTNSGSPLYADHPMINIINREIYAYIWYTPNPPISRQTLALPIQKGGLYVTNIAQKSIALRAKQINQIMAPNCKLPSTKFARYWMAKWLWFMKPWTRFLQAYIPTTPASQNKGYDALVRLFHHKSAIYTTPQNLPTSKKIYQESLKLYDEPAGNRRWRLQGFPTPDWTNSWKALNSNVQQTKLWKLRHHTLLRLERQCAYCEENASHAHLFATCQHASRVWQIIIPIIRTINPPHLPLQDKTLIIGVRGSDKRSIIANTLITSTIHYLWNARNKVVHEQINIPPHVIARQAIFSFRSAIKGQFEIHKRKNTLDVFQEKFLIRGIASVINGDLVFDPP